jgi:hypothetical protein
LCAPMDGGFAGVNAADELSPPGRECWPEVGARMDAVLRRTGARRRWKHRALACSGEDTPYGSWDSPPGNGPLTGVGLSGNNLSSRGRMLAGAGRACGRLSSDERGLVGGDNFVRSPAPAKPVPAGDQVLAPFPPVDALSPELRFQTKITPDN